jgi:hypothetical protein
VTVTSAPQLLCPICQEPLADEQSWCLNCGTPARTLIASAPHWRSAIVIVAVAVLLALAAIGFGIARLVSGNSAPTAPASVTRTVAQ